MKTHLSNAAYGILDYGAFPIGMLVVAPVLLRHLGVAQYGVWTVAGAAVSVGGVIASGFGDANIQYVASQRGRGDAVGLARAVRSLMGINLTLGLALGLLCWLLAQRAAAQVTAQTPALREACLWSLRIACVLLVLRALESVCISTQRAFERYGAAVRISIVVRLVALASAAGLSCCHLGVAAILLATAFCTLAGLLLQLERLRRLLGTQSLWPAFDRDAMRVLLSFGLFSWLQAVAGVVFSQVDRLMLGVSLGAAAVTSYALCAQMAQPVFGFSAAGLHFLFPYLANRRAAQSDASLLEPVLAALACNVLFVAAATVALLLFAEPILDAWVGGATAQSAAPVLTLIVYSSALLGLNVTATYALLSMGCVRTVTAFHLLGGVLMLALILYLTPRLGIRSFALARLGYSVVPLGLYIPLLRRLWPVRGVTESAAALCAVGEER
jgi:O-antigen/teichoic acid export membrane protein